MSVEDKAEELVQELQKHSSVQRVEATATGEVQVFSKGEFKIVTNDMDSEHEAEKVKLPSYLPARLGKKAFRKLDKEISDSGFSVNDPDSLLDAKDYLINEMMKRNNYDYRADDLSMQSYNRIGDFYWEKVVQAKKNHKS